MKNHLRAKHAAAAVALVLTGFTLAMPQAMAAKEVAVSASGDAKFNSLDANHDGQLTRAEVSHINSYGSAFDQADANHDGRLNSDEFIKAESIHEREMAAAYVDDSLITAKVKGSLLKELKSLSVSVETYHGNVLLSGFVDDEKQIRQALTVASSVDGVRSVKNGLVVK